MKLFFHCLTDGSSSSFSKIEWLLYKGDKLTDSGNIISETPTFTFDFIVFLLAIGKAKTLIGYDLDYKLKAVGSAMKKLGLTIEKPNKIVHLDLKGSVDKPLNVEHLYEMCQAKEA